MKKLAIIMTAMLILSAVAGAQTEDQTADKKLRFGLKGGAAFSILSGAGSDKADPVAGFMGGGFISYRTAEDVRLIAEIQFVQKGFELKGLSDSLVVQGKATVKMDYIEIPVLFLYELPDWGAAVPYLTAGGALSFIINSKVEAAIVGPGVGEQGEFDTQIENSVDFGFVFGTGIDFPIMQEKHWMGFDFRFTWGVLDAFGEGTTTPPAIGTIFGDKKWTHSVFSGQLTFTF